MEATTEPPYSANALNCYLKGPAADCAELLSPSPGQIQLVESARGDEGRPLQTLAYF